ncbi:BamA/TamA family outer membrane protein [Reichenbachiella sp. MSK19-1]|uniref:BamA/TamA family outer membrane protein n=1 Tax=Reichenbachiella sp. MSK19-1 TaxID=1897631 RepID=UPI000E6C25A6|nr:BamA/TamA family outer membrane protein [Reichenbachiella sp. MSK19-1]
MLKYRQIYNLIALVMLFAALSQWATAQKYEVVLHGIPDRLADASSTVDSSAVIQYTRQVTHRLQREGYWLSSMDSITWREGQVEAYYYLGSRYERVLFELRSDQVIEQERRLSRDKNSVAQVNKRIEGILSHYEDNGYPFASVVIDSSVVHDQALYLWLEIDPGMLIRFDSLEVVPAGVLKERFVSRYLGLNYGHYYSESRVLDIGNKLENIPAVKLKAMESTFSLQRSQIKLELERQKVNYFDGILGLVPSANGSSRVDITGELNLSLKNLFQSAKQFELHWERYTTNSQRLEIHYLHPAFLGMPLDLFLGYDQLKQDTLFSNRSLKAAFDYYPSGRMKLRTSYENELGNELNDDSGESGSFKIDYYGLSGEYWRLDDRVTPRQGIALAFDTQVGYKDIRLDTVADVETTQYRLSAKVRYYQPVRRRSVLHVAVSGGWMESDVLYLNDLFRLGGLRSIRGFNENEFYAGSYVYTNLEWRFYIENKSYLLAFYDQGWMSYDIVRGSFSDRPSGVGLGMQFDAAGGSFLMLYGLGRRENQGFSFDSSKIHFGYSALF